MRWEYHVAAVGGESSDVAVDLVDVLNALGAQGWDLATALPLRESDALLLIVRRPVSETTGGECCRAGYRLASRSRPGGAGR